MIKLSSRKTVRNIEKEQIYLELENCRCTNRRPYTYPFFFEIKQQKVMLITLIPSFQAVYRQLASIRFFRNLFLALCGPNPAIRSGSLVTSFLDAIYWSHYHKCYLPKEQGSTIPRSEMILSDCYGKYINREISALCPKLIVMLGAPVADKLLGRKLGAGELLYDTFEGTPVISANFPLGLEPEFVEVRKKLKLYIPWVDIDAVSENMISYVADTKETLAVHAHFEMNGLYAFWRNINSRLEPLKDGNIDERWIQREVIPRLERYSFIVSCVSFLEDQIKPLLAENLNLYNQLSGKKIVLEDQIQTILEEYKSSKDIPANYLDELKTLRILRNHLVHQGGRINPDRDIRKIIRNHSSLFIEPSGMIIITEEYCEGVLDLVSNFVNLFSKLPTKY